MSWIKVGFGDDPAAIRDEIERRMASARSCPGAHWVRLDELETRPREVLGKLLGELEMEASSLPWENVEAQIRGDDRLD